MKRQVFYLSFIITVFSFNSVTAQVTCNFSNTPLLEALQTVSSGQTDYSIDILADNLADLQTSAKISNLSVPDAVKLICKNQPVKVKIRGKNISVQYDGKVVNQKKREIQINGNVEDGFLKIPLTNAKVTICRTDSSVLDSAKMTTYMMSGRPRYAVYMSKVTTDESELLVHAELKGYGDVWQRVKISKQTEVEVPTLEMRRRMEMELDEVVIKATRVKMYYRGDTIVYDATAFKLPEGSMLDDLIRQMPGVTLNDAGEIFVNGRKVDELMLNSRSFFKGNRKIMLENLPYYTVKDIKVYDRQSDKSRALGYDVDPKQYVMDVNLKPEYNRGYIANVEAAAGTNERWLARAFALGFSDHFRFTLMGNVNNVNESRHIGQSGNWTPATMPKSMLTTRSIAADVDYHSKGDNIKNNLNASYTSTTDVSESRSRYEQFLQGCNPLSLTETYNRNGNRRWSAHDEFKMIKPFYLYIVSDFNYAKNHGSFNSIFDQWTDSLVASERTRGFSENRTWGGYLEAQGAFNIGKNKNHLDFYIKAEHNENESGMARRYDTRLFTNPQQTIRHNVDDISNTTTWGAASVNYNTKISKDINMHLGEFLYLIRIDSHDYLYHPDTLTLASQIDALSAVTDVNNSYESRTNVAENTFSISFYSNGHYKYSPNLPVTVDYQRWNVGVSIPLRHESLDYQRGMLDTLAKQNTLYLNTSASFRNVSKDGKRDLRFNVGHKRSGAMLSDRITYRDDSQPLVVKLGNPDLKSFITSNLGIDFWNKGGGNQQQWHVGASGDIYHRQTAQSVSFSPETGVYTYQPMNVNGAYRFNAKFDISRAIDNNRYWTWQTNADAGFHHSIDHSMFTGEIQSHKNIVNTLTLHDNAYIQYNKDMLNIRATGDIRWRHSEGKMQDFKTLNATDFQYGLSARYTIPRINMTLSADLNMYSRRGYGSNELNTDDLVMNASISQPFLKGKLIARIEAFDLLHQLSSTQYAVNAHGRTETWYRSLPHYVMAHLVYHWNKNPKKK